MHTFSKYVVLIDPLDGSSNIDVNVSGNYFLHLQTCNRTRTPVQMVDFFAKRIKQVAAGYVVYGFFDDSLYHRKRQMVYTRPFNWHLLSISS